MFRGGARLRAVLALAVLALAVLGVAPAPARGQVTADALEGLTWRYVGPVGNRVSAVAGVPGDVNTYYFGAASGGVFKSEDGGHAWRPVFDGQPAASVGAMAVAPSNPDIVWVGTGEPFIRSNVSHGNGVYRSLDGGETWEHMGLDETGRVGRILVHPEDPDIVYVAALGHLYGPQPERGVYRTRDGGESWERVLFVDEDTGASDVAMSPSDPGVLYAGMWTMLIRTWGRWSGGPGDGLYRSSDGGDTWERLEGNGLPAGTLGKIGLATTPAMPRRVYALIETNSNRDFDPVGEPLGEHQGVLWRSDDDGATWAMISADHTLVQRPHYYSRAVVAPDNADEVHFMATVHSRSLDGGASIRVEGGGDNHDMWIDPLLPDRMIIGHDQGLKISTNRGEDWYRPQLPIAQMYHVTVDNAVPYNLYGNRQDGGASRGPSRTGGGSIAIGEWTDIGGCESGWAVPDTVSNDVVWSGCYEGILDRTVISTGHSRTVSVWPDNPEGWEAARLRYRFQWTFPIHISPHDADRVYVGSQHVHRTTDGGQSWQVISPDLTTDDEERQRRSGGLTPDDVSPTYYSVLFAIAESPLEEGVIWTGSNDGLVQVTRDGGGSWTDVTGNIPGLPPRGTVSNVEPSRFAAGKAYVTVDRHQLGDFDPYVYVTEDYGAGWRRIDGGVPRSVLAFAHVVREDPRRPGLLYLGTENAVYASWDDGGSWTSLQSDLPHVPVYWLTIQPHFNDLVAGTYGRGFWIMDDVTPLQAMTAEIAASGAHLFSPKPAYRFLSGSSVTGQPGDPAAGRNPPYGASLSYWLGADASSVEIEIVDLSGEVIATVPRAPRRVGVNRAYWNLRHEASRSPRLWMPPVEHAHAMPEGQETRGAPDGGRVSILAAPGTYTVRLTVDGRSFEQPLEVLQDPTSEGTLDGVREQIAMLEELRDEANRAADLIERIEGTRSSVRAAADSARDRGGLDALAAAAVALEAELVDLEMNLVDLRLTGGNSRQDTIRWPRQLFARITSLAGYISGTDHRPTDQAREVHALYKEQLSRHEATMDAIEATSVRELNRLLAGAGLRPVGPGGT
jgi:photosystem II stability/assembly factor-like uncharacterized protein